MSKKTKHPMAEMAQRTFLDAARITELENALAAALLHIEGLMDDGISIPAHRVGKFVQTSREVAGLRKVLENNGWRDER